MSPRQMCLRLSPRAPVAIAWLAIAWPTALFGQSLAERIAAGPDGRVQFAYATREGVCGDGRSYVHIGDIAGNQLYGSFNDLSSEPCVHGPARVVLDRASGQVVGLRVYAGPPADDGARDLGTVSVQEAARYLLTLAASAQGAVPRDAIMPAMLADSVDNQSALVALARDQTRSRETRRTAISWLGREPASDGTIVPTLISLATDQNDNQSVRQQALSTLVRLPGGAGIPPLIKLAGTVQSGWMASTALSVIAQSGDPRARDYLRSVVRSAALPDEVLAAAVRGFGQQYATAADIKTIRDAWPTFTGERTQAAAISAIAQFGGTENAQWLVALSRDIATTSNTRRRALEGASQAGVATADLVALYDRTTDPQLKWDLIAILSRVDDRVSIDKLITIARDDESSTARRRAIDALGHSADPRAKQALEALVERRP
jgi:HEAT repeat protein